MDPELPSWGDQQPQVDSVGRSAMIVRMLLLLVLCLSFLVGILLVMNQRKTKPSSTENVAVASATIVVSNNSFQPMTMRVAKGQSVTWINQDSLAHRIVSGPHPTHEALPDLDSEEPLSTGDSYTYTFEKSGTFSYHDEAEPLKVVGTIIVE